MIFSYFYLIINDKLVKHSLLCVELIKPQIIWETKLSAKVSPRVKHGDKAWWIKIEHYSKNILVFNKGVCYYFNIFVFSNLHDRRIISKDRLISWLA